MENNKNIDNDDKLGRIISKIVDIVLKLCMVFAVGFAIYGLIVTPHLELFKSEARIYEGEWIYEGTDGEEISFVMPYLIDSGEGELISVSTVLPVDVRDGQYICFITGRSIRVLLDGVEIYSYDSNASRLPGKVVKAVCIPVPLKAEYAGHKLTLIRGDADCFNGNLNRCYIGDLLGIVELITMPRLPQYIGAVLLTIVSIVTIIVFVVISFSNKQVLPLVYLAHGVLIISLWIMLDSYVFQFMFGRYFIDGVVAYMAAILMPIPFINYFNRMQGWVNRREYRIIEIWVAANFIILTALHVSGIKAYENMLVYINACTVIYIIIFWVVAIKDYYVNKNKAHSLVLVGFLGMCFLALADVIEVIIKASIHFDSKYEGLPTLMGLYVLLIFAICDQIKSLNELRNATQDAIAATKAKSEFLANMSHEIRTPINAIMGMNEMILRESEQDKIRDYAKDVDSASRNLLDIVNDILDFSKIESGMLEIIEDEYDLGEVIADVVGLVEMKAIDKNLKLKILVNPEMPCKLRGDEKRLREVIINILNNAVKYTDKGHIELKVDGDITDNSLMLKIDISDTGQGIREEDIGKIFGGFERVNLKKNKNVEGTGLGLTITKNIVELMHGNISVKSEYGVGSVFTINIPQTIVDNERVGDYKAHKYATQKNEANYEQVEAPNASVLIVDDNPMNLKVLGMLVKRTKMQITAANSGKLALEHMKNKHFDIILLDHMMPEMDGVETITAAKVMEGNMCTDTPIIALTANAIVGAREFYLEAGFDDYISKPVLPPVLMETLIKYLPEDKVTIIQ